jgi:hypothetical protein
VTGWRPHGLAVLGRHTREVTCVKRGLRADVRATRVRVIVDFVPEGGGDPRVAQAEAYRLAAAVCDNIAEAEGWLAADPVVRMIERGARVTVTGNDAVTTVARFFEGAADAALAPRSRRRRPRRSTKLKAKAKERVVTEKVATEKVVTESLPTSPPTEVAFRRARQTTANPISLGQSAARVP